MLDLMLDHPEFGRWHAAAEDEAEVARALIDLAAFNAVVLHAEQAAQLHLKGLLRGIGQGSEAWGHALADLATRATTTAGLDLSEDLRAAIGALARDYMPTRYPDAVVTGTPRGNYSRNDADRALEVLADLAAAVAACWQALLQKAADS